MEHLHNFHTHPFWFPQYGYKTKELRHTIRKPEPEYIEEPAQKPKKPSRDFIKKNREQYRMQKQDDDKENHRSNSASTGRPSSEIKAGTVTLTQDQLNALLATVGKLKPGEGGSLRISIGSWEIIFWLICFIIMPVIVHINFV